MRTRLAGSWWLALRVLGACALGLWLAHAFAQPLAGAALLLLRPGLEQAAPDFRVLQMGVVNDRGSLTIAALAVLDRTVVIGGQAVVPDGQSPIVAAVTAGSVLQLLLAALILLVAWPAQRGWEWPLRALLAMPPLALALLLDAPLSMASLLWQSQLQAQGAAGSPLVAWNTFLHSGGRVVLGLAAAGFAIGMARALTQRGRRSGPGSGLPLAQPPSQAGQP